MHLQRKAIIAIAAALQLCGCGGGSSEQAKRRLPTVTEEQRKTMHGTCYSSEYDVTPTACSQGFLLDVANGRVYKNGRLVQLKKDPDTGNYLDTDVADGEKYTYGLRSIGGNSNTVCYISTPRISTATMNGHSLDIRWNVPVNAGSYEYYAVVGSAGKFGPFRADSGKATIDIGKHYEQLKESTKKKGYGMVTVYAQKAETDRTYESGPDAMYFWVK